MKEQQAIQVLRFIHHGEPPIFKGQYETDLYLLGLTHFVETY